MRITNNVLTNELRNNLSRNIRNMEITENQLATGKRISKPSDDPTGIVASLRLSSRLRENKQFQENIDNAGGWLTTTDEVLGSLTTALNRTYELTVQGANGSLADTDREALADEIQQLLGEAKAISESTHGDRYIFGGTNTTGKPYDETQTPPWRSNDKKLMVEIGVGVEIPMNITAQDVFIDKNLMGTLESIYQHLTTGNTTALGSTDLDALQQGVDQVLACRAEVGARVNRLEMAKNRLLEQETNFTNLQAEVDGVDSAKVITDLKNQENVYKASLAVGARVIMPTLVDFIR